MSMGGGSAPSGNTSSTNTSVPWAGQQPSLLKQFDTSNGLFYGPSTPESWKVGDQTFDSQDKANAFAGANTGSDGTPLAVTDVPGTQGAFGGGTFNPQFFPGAGAAPNTTVVGFNPQETAGLQNVLQASSNVGNYFGNVTAANNNQLDPNFLTSNPGNDLLTQAAAAAPNNPAQGMFAGETAGALDNPANGTLGTLGAESQAGAVPLMFSAMGGNLGSQNPAWQQLSDSVSSSVLPQVESQFIKGGSLNSPQAAFAASQGLSSALAGPAYNWAALQAQQQQQAAQTLDQTGAGAAAQQGGLFNSGVGNQVAATQGLSGAYGKGVDQLLSAGQGISGNYNTAAALQDQVAAQAPAFANAVNSNAQVPFQVGQAQQQQAQNELGGQIQNYNYSANLPLNMLNAFAGTISGNYGGSSTLTQPYYTNPVGNALGIASGTAGLANGLFGSNGLFR